MDKVRLDFYLGVEGKLSIGDEVVNNHGLEQIIYGDEWADDFNERNDRYNEVFITSFADRENKGVQPVPDGLPVVVIFEDGHIVHHDIPEHCNWGFVGGKGEIKSWKPNYNKLLEMQKEHDLNKEFCKAADMSFNQEKPIEELMINAKESKMNNVYTQEMKEKGVTPSIGMEVKVLNKEGFEIEYGKHLIGQVVKALSEPLPASGSLSVQAIEFDGNCYCFRSSMLHPIKSKEELELEEAKYRQIEDLLETYSEHICDGGSLCDLFGLMQGNGDLSEIVLPLEGK